MPLWNLFIKKKWLLSIKQFNCFKTCQTEPNPRLIHYGLKIYTIMGNIFSLRYTSKEVIETVRKKGEKCFLAKQLKIKSLRGLYSPAARGEFVIRRKPGYTRKQSWIPLSSTEWRPRTNDEYPAACRRGRSFSNSFEAFSQFTRSIWP